MSTSASNNEKQQIPSCVKRVNGGTEIDSKDGNLGEEEQRVLPDPQPAPDTLSKKTKMAPGLLNKSPIQAMIAAGQLPTLKDQACSIAAPATRATHQPTGYAGYNIPVCTDGSTKDGGVAARDRGPDYKDQVRAVQPPPQGSIKLKQDPAVAIKVVDALRPPAPADGGPAFKDQVRQQQRRSMDPLQQEREARISRSRSGIPRSRSGPRNANWSATATDSTSR